MLSIAIFIFALSPFHVVAMRLRAAADFLSDARDICRHAFSRARQRRSTVTLCHAPFMLLLVRASP